MPLPSQNTSVSKGPPKVALKRVNPKIEYVIHLKVISVYIVELNTFFMGFLLRKRNDITLLVPNKLPVKTQKRPLFLSVHFIDHD